MDSSFVNTSSFKLGLKQTAQDSPLNFLQPLLHKLSPLPMYRRNLLNPSRTRECLRLKGYKFFAKLPAAGPATLQILQDIKNSHCIKSIQYFEFDHYLCDSSHITYLRRVCNKIKGIKRLNLVIRRVDNKVELGDLAPFLARFTRLTSLRIEFPNTQNVTENALHKLSSALGNCTFLKSLEQVNVNMPEKSQEGKKKSPKFQLKLRCLENMKVYISFRKGTLKHELDQQERVKERKLARLKTLDLTLSFAGEWSEKGMDQDVGAEMTEQILEQIPQLQRMRLKEIK